MSATQQQIAQIRASVGGDPDPASDRIWAERINAGTATVTDARNRIHDEKGHGAGNNVGQYVPPTTDGGASEPERDPFAHQAGAMRAVLDWLPTPLVNAFINEWIKHGNSDLAWGVVRTSSAYEQHFPGIKRDDGTLRMDEQSYLAHREAFRREFTQRGLNPELFESHHVDLIAGDVSIQEFRQRMQAKVEGVMENIPQVRQQFAQFYGIGNMDDRTLLAAALDPDVGLDIIQGRITASQVGAEAAAQGFGRSRERAEMLVQGGGLDQMGARELFSSGARAVPQMRRFAGRFNERQGFGIDQFEDAAVFGDQTQQRRMQRLQASEQAMFRQGGQVAGDRTGLSGLRR